MDNKIKFIELVMCLDLINYNKITDSVNEKLAKDISVINLPNIPLVETFFLYSSLHKSKDNYIYVDEELGKKIIMNAINEIMKNNKTYNFELIAESDLNFIRFIITNHDLLELSNDEYKELLITLITNYSEYYLNENEIVLKEIYREFNISEEETILRNLFCKVNSVKFLSEDVLLVDVTRELICVDKGKNIDQFIKFYDIISLSKSLTYKSFNTALQIYIDFLREPEDFNRDIVEFLLNTYINFINRNNRINYKSYNKILNGINSISELYSSYNNSIENYITKIKIILSEIADSTNNKKLKKCIISEKI